MLLAGVDARATTIALTDSGISQYCEVVESESDFYKWVAIPGETENDPISIEYVLAGTRVTYDIYNNSNYNIFGFAVGVENMTGTNAENEESHEGWSGSVINRWEETDLDSYWTTYLQDYDYAYYAHTYDQLFEPGNSDYSPAGEPLSPFTGITDEFSFTYEEGFLASPLIIFATDSLGQEIILNGESSHFLGEHRQYVDAAPVPEPSTMILLGLGLLGCSGAAKKRNK